MTGDATLAQGLVLKHERAPLNCVALETGLVRTGQLGAADLGGIRLDRQPELVFVLDVVGVRQAQAALDAITELVASKFNEEST